MMSINNEFSHWQQQWQSHPVVPVDLIRRIERKTLGIRAMRVAEIAVTILIGGGLIGATIAHPVIGQIYWLVLTLVTWLFIIVAWVISLRASKNAWNAAEPSISVYMDLQVRRYRQQINTIWSSSTWGLLFSSCLLIIVYEALSHALRARNVSLPWSSLVTFLAVGIGVNGIVLLGQVAKKRRLQSELDNMLDLQRNVS
jgi:pilus assembly protein TadC